MRLILTKLVGINAIYVACKYMTQFLFMFCRCTK